MFPNKWFILPGARSLGSLLRWDLHRALNRGWDEFYRLIGFLVLVGALVLLAPRLGPAYLEVLLPGVVAALLLHPFLEAGGVFVPQQDLPRRFRSTPVPLPWFALVGVVPRLVLNLAAVGLLGGIFSWSGYSFDYLLSPVFLIYFVVLAPGALGWGLGLGGLFLWTETDASARWGMRRLFEVLGAVYWPVDFLSPPLGWFQYLLPYPYLAEFARQGVPLGDLLTGWFLGGLFVAWVQLVLGGWLYLVCLRRYVQRGRLDRSC